MYRIFLTEKFVEQSFKLTKYDKKYKLKLDRILKALENDVNRPSLRLHKLSGTTNFSISVDKSVRILLTIEKDIIYLIRIGKHEEVY